MQNNKVKKKKKTENVKKNKKQQKNNNNNKKQQNGKLNSIKNNKKEKQNNKTKENVKRDKKHQEEKEEERKDIQNKNKKIPYGRAKLKRRKPINKPKYIWEYKEMDKWIPYNQEKQKTIKCFEKDPYMNIIETTNEKKESIVINLNDMTQYNKETKYMRRIRKRDENNKERAPTIGERIMDCEKLTKWEVLTTEKELKKIEKDTCPICWGEFVEEEEEEDDQFAVKLTREEEELEKYIVRICKGKKQTGHWFHAKCLAMCYNPYGHSLKCPCCMKRYGIEIGDMPKGTMTIIKKPQPIPSYPKCGTIQITYNFPSGVQGLEHQNPGTPYTGTGRTAYLPDNKEGNYVLELLKIGYERRLLFRVGTSVTTGADNSVVWNGVHHKTCTTGGTASFGYPDVTYFARVVGELNDKGVTLPYDIEYEHTQF